MHLEHALPETNAKRTAERRHIIAGIDCTDGLASRSEFCLTLKPLAGEGVTEMFQRLQTVLGELDATVTHAILFGSVSANPAAVNALSRIFGAVDWPITWAEGAACEYGPIAGAHFFAVSGRAVQRIEHDGRIVGSIYEDGARHCVLGGLGPQQLFASRLDQTRETLDLAAELLEQAGCSFSDVARTWFYLDEILDWYNDFNRVRNELYSRTKFRTHSWPASTGIGASNPAGSALVAAFWAVQPIDDSARVTEIASPLQCPAPAYGSAFSRAMEIESADERRLLISGTASIAPGGRTLWKGNAPSQVRLTMGVVQAILRSRGFGFGDVTRATAYFRNRAALGAFNEWCAKHGASLSLVMAQADICRDDLLFELEADARGQTKLGERAANEFAI